LNSVLAGFAAATAGSMMVSMRIRNRLAQAPGFAAVNVAEPPPASEMLAVPGAAPL